MKPFALSLSLLLAFCLSLHCLTLTSTADDEAKKLSAELEAAKKKLTEARVTLQYKFAKGETLHWKVEHLGATETTIQGNTQTSESRSVSTKVWQITGVDSKGNMTVTHSVANVDMWQKLSDRPEIRFNSKTDKTAPPEYENVAKTIGVPLTTLTFASDGKIVKRGTSLRQANLGLGDLVMLLPPKPVKVGSRWHEPAEIRIRQKDGRQKTIKTRKQYTLKKIETGVATISVETQVLTPVNNSTIKSQLVQQLTNGTIKFDIDAGRILKKEMEWDESVVGFNGADSMMKYVARYTEEMQSVTTADAGDTKDAAGTTARANPTDRPALRRR
ncbi:MAG: DUF6263 family protein [Pirellulaceae bacterium]|jgi:hypothetical protein|nr:DUF6263 family protein [Pirellulaceae bacterium]